MCLGRPGARIYQIADENTVKYQQKRKVIKNMHSYMEYRNMKMNLLNILSKLICLNKNLKKVRDMLISEL